MTTYATNLSLRGNNANGMDLILSMPRCRVARSTTQSILNGVPTKISFDATPAIKDTDTMFNPAIPDRVTARTTGLFDVKAWVVWAVSGAGSLRQSYIIKNGASSEFGSDVKAPLGVLTTCTSVDSIEMNAGDYLELYTFQDSGGALSTSVGLPSNSAEMKLCLLST